MLGRWLLAGVLILSCAAPPGCVNREVRATVFDRAGVKVFLRDHKRGFAVLERGFQHPIQISEERLGHILGALDIRGREETLAGIRAAFEPEQIPIIAEGLSKGLAMASPDQEVGLQIIKKNIQNLIFDRKRLSSFVSYVQNDLLYLHISRVDWKIPERSQKTALPIPRISEHPMKFKVVPTEGMYEEGVYAVSVEWDNPIFRQPVRSVKTAGERRERTILMETPDLPDSSKASTIPADLLPFLTSSQLRALADLEDARADGKVTEGHYRRERERILEEAREDSATSR